ncbi:MAG: hypothetical protein KDC66_18665 [Phaeodactylibacter sp.]|nr:hypothetical protein [Phaeodactylibacter sp.]MCB9275728.1 hypothetical protein [Lewinellaceae bacterium]
MKQHYFLWVLLAVQFACQSAADTPGRIAEDICDCMRPLAQSYKGVQDATSRNDLEALQRYAEEMERVMSDCGSQIEKKYGPLEGERGEQVKAAMQLACPDVVATLNEAESEYIK